MSCEIIQCSGDPAKFQFFPYNTTHKIFLLQTPSKIIVINANGNLESLQAIYDEKKKTILEMAKEANLKAAHFD